jgi:hypothetical protein
MLSPRKDSITRRLRAVNATKVRKSLPGFESALRNQSRPKVKREARTS